MDRQFRHLLAAGIVAFGITPATTVASFAVSSVIDVPPPQVQDFWVSVSRQAGGTLVFDGYAPDAATRDTLGQQPGADVNWLKLGSGAPAGYDAAMAFGLDVLSHLTEGRFALRGSVLSVTGTAASQADFVALQSLVRDAPAGFILAMAEVDAPRAEPYAFSLRRQANGNQLVSGYVPDAAIEQQILSALGSRASSSLRFGSGEPLDFAPALERVLPLFTRLSEGEIRLENGAWIFAGTPGSAADAEAIRAAFAAPPLNQPAWSLALAAPQPAAPPEPYLWQVEKSQSGALTMTGALPTAAMQRVLALRLGSNLADETDPRQGAPAAFITEALLASDVLSLLETGTVTFDGTAWQVEGTGSAAGAGEDIAQLVAATASDWTVTVSEPSIPAAAAPPPTETVPSPPSVAAPQPVEATEPTPQVEPEPAAEPAPVAAPPTPPADDGIDTCRAELAALSAQNAILFRSGAAILVPEAAPALAAVAAAISHCPAAAIDVAGHTDSDGEADANLALSVARAEAVIAALVGLGIAPERLYAMGFGESQPVADNATAAGKAQNRRIVVSVHVEP